MQKQAPQIAQQRGPRTLDGVRVLEFAGLGPAPFACMVLADMGADVVRVDRRESVATPRPTSPPSQLRGRRSIALDLSSDDGVAIAMQLVERSDVLVEGFRPGVMERLGLGPDQCLQTRPNLVYGRMTGWGQEGPLAQRAGHDVNYISIAGVLAHVGTDKDPIVPLNLVGDFGGGAMLLLVGVLAALLDARRTGLGQVVDAAMVDGAALLMTPVLDRYERGEWTVAREDNFLDGGRPWYRTYRTAGGGHVGVGPLEPKFYAEFLRALALDSEDLPDQNDPAGWPVLRERFAEVFATRTRDDWAELFAPLDACVTPVLSFVEAREHPHNRERAVFGEAGGASGQPQPAPRFSRSPSRPGGAYQAGGATADVLSELGIAPERQATLRARGVVASTPADEAS